MRTSDFDTTLEDRFRRMENNNIYGLRDLIRGSASPTASLSPTHTFQASTNTPIPEVNKLWVGSQH